MRICLVFTNFHLRNITGQPAIIYRLAEKLAERGEKVHIISNSVCTDIQCENIKLRMFLIKGDGNLKTYILNSFRIIQQLRNIKPDILHVHGYLLSIFYYLINLFFVRAKFFCSVTETIDIIENAIFRGCVTLSFKGAEKIFVTARYIKKQLINCGIKEDKILVTRIGLAGNFLLKERAIEEEIDLLFFGDSLRERGFDIVYKIAQRSPKLKFMVLLRWKGDNCKKELDLMRYLSNVRILFYPYSDTLEQLVLRSRIILLPYRWMGVRPPLSLVEAMALGKCVITSNMAGNDEIIQNNENGIMLDLKDIDQIYPIIDILLKDNIKRNNLGISARKAITEFYSQSEYDKIINSYG